MSRPTALDHLRTAWHETRRFIARVYEGADEANIPFLASGLTFDALLAAVPFLVLLLAAAGYVLSAEAGRAQIEIHEYLRRFLPDVTGPSGTDPFAPITAILERIVRDRGALSLLGLPLFVWFSTRLFGSLRAALCEVFDTEDTRSYLKGKMEDTALVVVTTCLFVINTALSQGLGLLTQFHPFGFSYVEFFSTQLLAFVVVVTMFVIVFRYAPAHRIRRDTALFAAIICAIGFELAKFLIGLYLNNIFDPDRIVRDATITAVLLFVLWTYYMAFVFLIGGQIAQVYELRRRQSQQRLLLH